MKNKFTFLILLSLISTGIMAQKNDTAKAAIEKGTKGDIILGKENQKQQLSAPPQMLGNYDSVNKQPTTVPAKKKKAARKNCKKKS